MKYTDIENERLAATQVSEVDLFQWDIVNATSFKGINQSMVIQDKTPDMFTNSQPGPGVAKIHGTWDTWQIKPGGMAGEIMMELPINTGTSIYPMAVPTYAILEDPVTDAVTSGKVSLSADKLALEAQDIATQTVHAFSEKTFKTGKIYFEVSVETHGGGVLIGLAPKDAPANLFFTNTAAISYRSTGVVYVDGKGKTDASGGLDLSAAWQGANSTVGIAIDFDNKKAWLRGPDGTWQGAGADPENGAGEIASLDLTKDLYPLVGVYSNAKAHINLGQKAFAHPLPNGFDGGVKVSDISTKTATIDGAKISARVTLKKVDDGSGTTKLMTNDQASATTDAVVITKMETKARVQVDPPTQQAFEIWLNANIGTFNNIFHAIDYAKLATGGNIKDTMKWIAPVYSDYAVTDLPTQSGTPTNEPEAIFAVLNQTEKSTVDKSNLAAQVSPALFDHIAQNENAVVAISAERLTEEILLNGATGVVADGETPKFQISNDKRVITNTAEFKMHKTKLAKTAEEVQPIVPPGGFMMRIEGRQILLEYTGLHFDYINKMLKKTEKVTFSFKQTMFLELVEQKNSGHHILQPTFNDPLDPKNKGKGEITNWENVYGDPIITMKQDPPETGLTAAVIGIIAAAAGLLLIGCGFAGVWYCRSGSVADDAAQTAMTDMSANNGAADVPLPPPVGAAGANTGIYAGFPDLADPEVVEDIYDDPFSPLQLFAVSDTAEAEEMLAPKPSKAMPNGSMLSAAHWGISLHSLRSMGRMEQLSDMGLTKTDIKKFAGGDVDVVGLETTVQNFLKTALSPFDWPKTTGFDLSTAHLNGALLLHGELKSATVKTTS